MEHAADLGYEDRRSCDVQVSYSFDCAKLLALSADSKIGITEDQ